MADRLTPPTPPEFQFPALDRSATPTEEEAAFARFLKEAPGILARERGLNARSLALLDAHARRLGLSSEDAAAAIRLLRSDTESSPPVAAPSPPGRGDPSAANGVPMPPPPPPIVEEAPEERAFEAWLLCNAKRIPDGVFRPYLESRARAIAVDRFGVDPLRLDAILDQSLAAIGMKRFTGEEAHRHFRNYLAQRLSQDAPIRKPDLDEFYRHGESWGFVAQEVDEEILRVRRSLVHADAHDRSVSAKLAALVIGAVVALVAFLAFLAVGPDFVGLGGAVAPYVPPVVEDGGGGSGGGLSSAPPALDSFPAWWSAEAALAHAQLSRDRPDVSWVKDVRSNDPARRALGYQAMAAEASDASASPVVRQALDRLRQELILREPDAKAEDALRRASLAIVVPPAGSIGTPDEYAASFATLQSVGCALTRSDAPRERVDRWKRALAAELKLSPERLEETDWLSACFAAVGGVWLDRLAAAELQLAETLERRRMLQRLLERFVASRRETDRLDANFIRDFLLRHPTDWRSFESGLIPISASPSVEAQAAAIDLMEATSEPELRDYLARTMRARYDLARVEDPAELAALLREKIGVASSGDFQRQRRVASLTTAAAPRLAQDRFLNLPPDASIRDLEELTRLTTQAYALRSELHFPVFDDLADPVEDDPSEIPTPRSGGNGFVEFSDQQLVQLREQSLRLRNADRLGERSRLDTLRRIADLRNEGSDIPYDVAEDILHYAAADFVSAAEFPAIATELKKIARWPMLTLALVDAIGTWSDARPNDRRIELVRIFGETNWTPTEKNWRESAMPLLLQRAGERLAAMTQGSPAASAEMQAAVERIVMMLDMRRGILVPGDVSPSASIGEAYRALATAAVQEAEAKQPASPAVAEAKRLLPAVERLAGSDLQRAALYQRLAIRLAAERAAQETPAFADQARIYLDALAASDVEATDVLQQLLSGERTALAIALGKDAA